MHSLQSKCWYDVCVCFQREICVLAFCRVRDHDGLKVYLCDVAVGGDTICGR